MTPSYDINELLSAVEEFPRIKLLVVGDVMLDEFLWGRVTRISPEAPVPVVDVVRETRLLGGAANVINNLVSVGGQALLCGVAGQDRPGQEIKVMLEEKGVEPSGIIQEAGRPTTVKTRVVAHAQQVVRFDREKRIPLGNEARTSLFRFLQEVAGAVDGVIVSDYGKGVVTSELMDEVRRLFKPTGRVVAVDPKVNNFKLYRNVTIITPNHHEAALGSGLPVESEADLNLAGARIREDLDCDYVLITRGEQGMTLFSQGAAPTNIPTVARQVFDVTGAGDTVIAIMTLGLAAGLSPKHAAVLANFAAGVVVGEVGTSAVTASKLKKIILSPPPGIRNSYL